MCLNIFYFCREWLSSFCSYLICKGGVTKDIIPAVSFQKRLSKKKLPSRVKPVHFETSFGIINS